MKFRPSRRWIRFSIRTLLVAVTICGIALGWFCREWSIVRRRESLRVKFEPYGSISRSGDGYNVSDERVGRGDKSRRPSALRIWLGDEAAEQIHYWQVEDGTLLREVIEAFPEADIFM